MFDMKKSLGAKTLAQPTPAWLVGTYDADGKANIMTIAWGGICCSSPPCAAVSLRKATYTYDAIVARRAFTINIPSDSYVREADYAGIVSGRDVDKFAVTGLTPVRSELVDAPYVAEFPLILECRLLHTVEIGLHTQFIGEIIDVKADESVLNEKGLPDAAKVRTFSYDPGSRNYFATGAFLAQGFSIGRGLIDDSGISRSQGE
jgi:flavin reductase (DIM6/NTAB) family NADH-FMN oxidoreductase RutF